MRAFFSVRSQHVSGPPPDQPACCAPASRKTDVEQRIWLAVRNRRLGGFKLRRQATIGPYIVDFLCIEAMLIVELDGGQHEAETDGRRTAFLESHGYRILRFWNNDVIENEEGVLTTILDLLLGRTEKKALSQPSPTKAGEG